MNSSNTVSLKNLSLVTDFWCDIFLDDLIYNHILTYFTNVTIYISYNRQNERMKMLSWIGYRSLVCVIFHRTTMQNSCRTKSKKRTTKFTTSLKKQGNSRNVNMNFILINVMMTPILIGNILKKHNIVFWNILNSWASLLVGIRSMAALDRATFLMISVSA